MDKVNCAIPLAETQIEISGTHNRKNWFKMPAEVTMRLSPTPRVFIEITIPNGGLLTMTGLGDLSARPKLRLQSGLEIETFVTEWGIGEVFRSLLIPAQQPVTVIQTGENLQSVKFNLINFSSLNQRARPASLEAGPWRIEIKPLPELSEIKKRLKAESGYALTHEGSIRRSDGESFSAEEAHKLLHVLHLFLSFARGGRCGVTLIAGNDENGNKAWEQWGAYSTSSWFHLSSWLDHRHNNDGELSKAWPGFWRILEQKTDAPDGPVRVALFWYLRSNESNDPYSGIILTQAALERLVRQLLPNEKYRESGNAAERIRAVLEETGVDTAIPQSCKELRAMGRGDGPEILTIIRNDLVHAETRTHVCLEAYLEARDLGQWYVELLLLRLFGYEGKYANRLAYNYERICKPEVVPWTRCIEGTG